MKLLTCTLVFICTSLLNISACAQESQSTSAYLIDGETLTYSGSAPNLLFIGANAGKVTLKTSKIRSPGEYLEDWQIKLDLDLSGKIRWAYNYDASLSSIVDDKVFKFLKYNKKDGQPSRRREETYLASYEKKQVVSHYVHPDKTKSTKELAFTEESLTDPLSLLYYLRTLSYDKKEGVTPPFKIFNRGKITEVSLDYKYTTSRQRRSRKKVIHIKPSQATRGTIIRKRDVEIFLDPETKIPLRINILGIPVIGKLVLELKSSNHPKLKL
ncbi:MAG: DUF3108 domain-containing protein [Planctomycetes bacterium]|nr:DUF3108 domain-containing protein [Planctomycetota bacterium]